METRIEIRTNPRPRYRHVAITAILQVAVIGIGVAAESAAMQWSGFAVLVVMMVGFLDAEAKKNNGLTFDEARRRLDEIEAEEARV